MENNKLKTQHQLNTNDANMKCIRENSVSFAQNYTEKHHGVSTSKKMSQIQMNNTDI